MPVLRSGSVTEEEETSGKLVDEVVAAVMQRVRDSEGHPPPPPPPPAPGLLSAPEAAETAESGLAALPAAPSSAEQSGGVPGAWGPPRPAPVTTTASDASFHTAWIGDLRRQVTASSHLGFREKEEIRALLIIADGGGPPPDHSAWYWCRVRFMIVVAHHGWGAAIADARTAETEQLGIHLDPAVVPAPASQQQQFLPPPAAGAGGSSRRRGRGPSGLRAPAGPSSAPSASGRK